MIAEIQIKLTRDSVCMGDDVWDHTKKISVIPQNDVTKTVMKIAKEYLPHIAGHGHTWDCVLNGTKCAVINGNCLKISPVAAVFFSEINALYFKYNSATY